MKSPGKAAIPGLTALLFIASGCDKPPKPIIVGSENSTEQVVVGEIVAQRLERRLQCKVERRLGLGDELILYQAIVSGNITLYPDDAAAIETTILRERHDSNPDIVREHVRNELRRTPNWSCWSLSAMRALRW